MGCRRSSAAQRGPSKPVPATGATGDLIPPEPCLTNDESRTREDLLKKFKEPLPLLEPGKAETSQKEAGANLRRTFESLPGGLLKRIDVSQPNCRESKIACYVDVEYPDWRTFVEVNRAIIDAQPATPFMTFPGPRYRSGRVRIDKKDKKFLASWFLSLPLRGPRENRACKEGKGE